MDRKPFARAIQSRLPLLVFILCMIQPVMDVLSYWLDVAGADNTITLLLRLLVLVATVLAGFVLSGRKWIYFLLCGVLILLEEQDAPLEEAQQQLAQTVAGFLGRQMES